MSSRIQDRPQQIVILQVKSNSAVHCTTVRCSTVQCSAVQCREVQYHAVQYSLCCRVEKGKVGLLFTHQKDIRMTDSQGRETRAVVEDTRSRPKHFMTS